MRKKREQAQVQSITSAQTGLSIDQSSRARRYFISMMVRTACFILTVILPSPYRWIALFGAVVLPYVAVVVANAGRETITGRSTIFNSRAIASGKDQSKDLS
jgi:hypothetical protein